MYKCGHCGRFFVDGLSQRFCAYCGKEIDKEIDQ